MDRKDFTTREGWRRSDIMPDFYHDPVAPVQPDQFAPEFSALLGILDKRNPQRILEIGIREGGTLYQWIKHTQPGAQIVAVDLPGVRWGYEGSAHTEQWSEWAAHHGVNLTVIIADSHEPDTIAKVKEYAPYDFIFIDGDHSLTGVTGDFIAYGRMVDPICGGMIAMHDILPDKSDGSIDGWRLWRIIEQSGYHALALTSEAEQDSRGIGVVYV